MNTPNIINLKYYKCQKGKGNFGDELSPYIVEALSHKKTRHTTKSTRPSLIAVGSYLHEARNGDIIWGSGILDPKRGLPFKRLCVKAIRGPKTRFTLMKKGIKVPQVYGDPALLMPSLFKNAILPEYSEKIGVVPHFSQIEKYRGKLPEPFVLINPTNHFTEVINKISSCKAITASSLHGLIIADAYGIPNIRLKEIPVKPSDFKYKDYYASQGRKLIDIKGLKEFEKVPIGINYGNKINLDKLLSTFPY